MFFRLLMLVILIPMADLILLLVVNSYISWLPTLFIIVSTAFAGWWLSKRQWDSFVTKLRQRKEPASVTEIFSDGAMILLAGVLLITPGFISDTIGITLLFPSCRAWYRKRLAKWVSESLNIRVFSSSYEADSVEIVDGKVHTPKHPQPSPNDPERIEASPF